MDGMTLPNAEWRHRDGLDRLSDALGAGEGMSRFVGGAVRDALLGLPVADIDIATRHTPEDVIDLLRRAGIRTVPTGLAHGTVTAVLESGPVEVTTLRRDVSTDGRRATVAFTDDWREDAARRDFTMNALYADPRTSELFDYFGGLADLEARRVRFIGDPLQRIAEDHLRILRFFRFLARFGDAPDPAGLDACTARAKDLMALSRERIADELLKLLVAKDAVHVVRLMIERSILEPVLPEVTDTTRFARLVRIEEATQPLFSALLRLVSLLPIDSVETVGARLKLSNADRKRMALAAQPLKILNARELSYRLGVIGAHDQLLLSDLPESEIAQKLQSIDSWNAPRLPLAGGSLVERGLSKGPEVARALRAVEDRWIAEGFPDADRVAAIADEVVAQALRSVKS